MRLAWLSDVHLNFVRDEAGAFEAPYRLLCETVLASNPDAVLISGDIAEAPDLIDTLDQFGRDLLNLPIYFVLGNHDFYKGSVRATRAAMQAFCESRPQLCYLSQADAPVMLTSEASLVGHDGWADGRIGDYDRSDVRLNDYFLIQELRDLCKTERLAQLNHLGDEAAAHLRRLLKPALAGSSHVVVLTHVPPFWDACLHRGERSDPDWAPHFACAAVGEVLIEAALANPHRQITVLCGHTHSPACYQPRPNLLVLAADVEYGAPRLQQVLQVR